MSTAQALETHFVQKDASIEDLYDEEQRLAVIALPEPLKPGDLVIVAKTQYKVDRIALHFSRGKEGNYYVAYLEQMH